MLASILAASLLLGQRVLVMAVTYDVCPSFYDDVSMGQTAFVGQVDNFPACITKCETTVGCTSFATTANGNAARPLCVVRTTPASPYKLIDPFTAFGYPRSNPLVPSRDGLSGDCAVCRTETCYTCAAPSVYSTKGDCITSCPIGQTENRAGGCICVTPGCDVCVAPQYYSSESGACVSPTVVTSTITESASTTETATATTTPPTSTITIVETSTTTPATSTITAVTTSSTGRTNCASIRATFPAACCPNKYDANLRPVSAGKLRRRALQFTTTLTTTTVTSTSTTTETIAAATPLATVTTTTFAEAATPLTTTSTTAFALSTACVSEVSTGLSRCPSNPKPVITALLSAYRKSGKRFVIDCGAAGMFEQA